jgi:hypothetical protein
VSLPYPIPSSAHDTRTLSLTRSGGGGLSTIGLDVIALQRALVSVGHDLVADGIFGSDTFDAVWEFQKKAGLEVDGIAGQHTQFALNHVVCAGVEKSYGLPSGILAGLVYNESLGYFGAVNDSVGGGKDLGSFQRRVLTADLNDWTVVSSCYDAYTQATRSAQDFKRIRDSVPSPTNLELARFGVHTGDRGRWELAVLNHNYPAGVAHLARGETVWRFIEKDILRYTDDKPVLMSDGSRGVSRTTGRPAKWVQDASGGRLIYVHQWCGSYIEKATNFVAWR